MIEIPVFISYRRDDGSRVAGWLREILHGRSLSVTEGSIIHWVTPSVYLDQAASAVSDWRALHQKELERARAFLVICTPGAMHEFPEDTLYYEFRWWLENRPVIAPILIAPHGARWIPTLISSRWPNAQFISVDVEHLAGSQSLQQQARQETSIQSILGGISQSIHVGALGSRTRLGGASGLFQWEKDRGSRYIGCNENYARAAGYDSPASIIGKTDDDMPWRSLAEGFRAGDLQVINGVGPPREHVQEKEIMVDKVADILVFESQLLDHNGACVGVTGYFSDITGYELIPRGVDTKSDARAESTAMDLGALQLSNMEIAVFRGIVDSHPPAEIANSLGVSTSEVEEHVRTIKNKLQCTTFGDVIVEATRSGLPLQLFGPDIRKKQDRHED